MPNSIEIKQLFDYVTRGVSAYHVASYTQELLEAAGFQGLDIKESWQLQKGGRYYCMPFDTNIYAFTLGENLDLSRPARIAGAHIDFPGIKIKPNPDIKSHGYLQLNTEVYGGPILNTFFDRPLSLAGCVMLKGADYEHPVSVPVDFAYPLINLPNLAVHMNRGVNENGVPIDNQRHLLPIITLLDGEKGSGSFLEILATQLETTPDQILDYDLMIYNMDPPMLTGLKEEFISAPRLDDLTSVSALVHGLIEAGNPDRLNMICLFDNEEIGSLSKQGADSQMPATILAKIWQAFGKTSADCIADLSDGMLISADVAHAYHPNYPKPQDITNYPTAGSGLVLKTAANQSYAWDTRTLAKIIGLCKSENIACQRFVKESGTRGGGTIGSIITSHIPMGAADLGVGLLAMHSAREFMGTEDQKDLCRLLYHFFNN